MLHDWTATIPIVGIFATLLATWWTHQQRATFDMIDGIYALCHRLHEHMLAEWRISHLMCIEESVYHDICSRITGTVGEDREALIAKERLFAVEVFLAYEQAYYQWRHSSVLLMHRRRFLREMLLYFTDRLLRNPRLLAYLASDHSGRSLHLEPESTQFLLAELARRPTVLADDEGFFAYAIPLVS